MADSDMLLKDDAATLALGHRMAAHLQPGDAILLSGGLGAGKTTLARGILSGLGLESEAPSPSFAIIQPYDVPDVRVPVAHVDLYRLDDASEIEELGLDEYLTDSVLLLEWPERMDGRLPPGALLLSLAIEPDGQRRLTVAAPEAWRARWQRI